MGKEVLVVDDDPAIVRALSIRLTALGYRVRSAPDGLMALEAINTSRPDVVLLDLRMPQVDGWTVLRLLRAAPLTVSLPVIVVSANAQDAAERQAMDAGATFVIGKPFDWPKLAEAIETVLARSAAPVPSEAQPS